MSVCTSVPKISRHSVHDEVCYCLLTEPTVGPSTINATALSAFEIQVSWEPVQQLSGILRGYEVMSCINAHLDFFPTQQTVTDGQMG